MNTYEWRRNGKTFSTEYKSEIDNLNGLFAWSKAPVRETSPQRHA